MDNFARKAVNAYVIDRAMVSYTCVVRQRPALIY